MSYNISAKRLLCPICRIRIADTVHHVVPRQLGGAKDDPTMFGKRKVPLCFSCHQNLHMCVKNADCSARYNSLEKILADKELIERILALPIKYARQHDINTKPIRRAVHGVLPFLSTKGTRRRLDPDYAFSIR
jgi:hypothetical protein